MIRQRKQQTTVLPLVHNGNGHNNGSSNKATFPGINTRRIKKRRGSSKDTSTILRYYAPYLFFVALLLLSCGWYFSYSSMKNESSSSTNKKKKNDTTAGQHHRHHHHQLHNENQGGDGGGHHASSHRRVDPKDIHNQFAEYKQARENYDKTVPQRNHPEAAKKQKGGRHRHGGGGDKKLEDEGGSHQRGGGGRQRKVKGEDLDGATQKDNIEKSAGIVGGDKKAALKEGPTALDHRTQDDGTTEAPVEVKCSDGSQGYLNDDFCDCPDGSDETETAACSHLTIQKAVFHCNDGKGNIIYASRVGDGVWDCADGSDER